MAPQPELDLVRGTFDLILLKTLSWGPMHGLGVLRWIEQVTEQRLQIEEGALYPALHRLEARGLISAVWRPSDNNRRAKFYGLTAAGRKQLEAQRKQWERFSDAVALVLRDA